MDFEKPHVVKQHQHLLSGAAVKGDPECFENSPLLTPAVLRESRTLSSRETLTQYGLLGGLLDKAGDNSPGYHGKLASSDSRLFYNTMAPSSTFICGSQGSGKSHTLSCLLENCLARSDASVLPKPLTGLVFHYDSFISDEGGSPCEAAYLASLPGIKVRVLCSPSNITTIKNTYSRLNVQVQSLQIDSRDLNTKRMLDLMAVNQDDGVVPLYIYTIHRILREMRIAQQHSGERFKYEQFKTKLLASDLTPQQLAPLNQRLSMLESFMPALTPAPKGKGKGKSSAPRTDWKCQPGLLTIVDLSCPCITPATACSLFNVFLSIFLEQDLDCGRVVALDEAHKYMSRSAESLTMTSTLLSAVRLQRHLGVRIIVSTQEPTIAPALLDLCSVTVIHRFSSPAWLRALRAHIAVQGDDELDTEEEADGAADKSTSLGKAGSDLFKIIVSLKTGEALIFSPSSPIRGNGDGGMRTRVLGKSYVRVKIRARISEDGGKSVMAK